MNIIQYFWKITLPLSLSISCVKPRLFFRMKNHFLSLQNYSILIKSINFRKLFSCIDERLFKIVIWAYNDFTLIIACLIAWSWLLFHFHWSPQRGRDGWYLNFLVATDHYWRSQLNKAIQVDYILLIGANRCVPNIYLFIPIIQTQWCHIQYRKPHWRETPLICKVTKHDKVHWGTRQHDDDESYDPCKKAVLLLFASIHLLSAMA